MVWFSKAGDASKSFGSFDALVTGLLLMIDSASHNTVCRLSSSMSCSFTVEFSTFLTDLMRHPKLLTQLREHMVAPSMPGF